MTHQHVQDIWEVFLSVSAEHHGLSLSVLALESRTRREKGGWRKESEGRGYKTKRREGKEKRTQGEE
jgi:hypothetical protein